MTDRNERIPSGNQPGPGRRQGVEGSESGADPSPSRPRSRGRLVLPRAEAEGPEASSTGGDQSLSFRNPRVTSPGWRTGEYDYFQTPHATKMDDDRFEEVTHVQRTDLSRPAQKLVDYYGANLLKTPKPLQGLVETQKEWIVKSKIAWAPDRPALRTSLRHHQALPPRLRGIRLQST